MLKEVSREDVEKAYDGVLEMNEYIQRQKEFYLSMFDNQKVDMKYYCVYDNNNLYVGEGVIVFRDERDNFEYDYERDVLKRDNCALIKNVNILEQYRGKGYFSQLFRCFEHLAKERGASEIGLSVTIENTNALQIYKHYGFVVVDCLKYKDIGEAYIMIKRLQ